MVCGQRQLSKRDADWFGGCGWYRRCLWWFRITKEAIRYLSDLRRSTLRHAGRTPPLSYRNALSHKGPEALTEAGDML